MTCWSWGPDEGWRAVEQREQQGHRDGGGNEGSGGCLGISTSGSILFCRHHQQPVPGRAYQVTGMVAKHFMWIMFFSARNNPVRTILLLGPHFIDKEAVSYM